MKLGDQEFEEVDRLVSLRWCEGADSKGPTCSRHARRSLVVQCALSESEVQDLLFQCATLPPVWQQDLVDPRDHHPGYCLRWILKVQWDDRVSPFNWYCDWVWIGQTLRRCANNSQSSTLSTWILAFELFLKKFNLFRNQSQSNTFHTHHISQLPWIDIVDMSDS